nr:maco-A 57 [Mamestra configurata nucleopolyhedrovirus A]
MTSAGKYPAVVSFDKHISDLRFAQIAYDQYKQRYVIAVEIRDMDEGYLFNSENDRMMNLLVPQQFKVRLDQDFYDVDTVEYKPVGRLKLTVMSRTTNIMSAAVFINMSYFDHDRAPWEIPEQLKSAFGPDEYEGY